MAIELILQFQEDAEQIRLINWFQNSTGLERQGEFAKAWRDSEDDSQIDFVNCFRFYENLSHQNLALRWLQQTTVPATWNYFNQAWSDHEFQRPAREGVLLKVPFFNQMLMASEGWRNCNTAACAMVANFLGVKISPDDYHKIVRQFGDTTDHTAQTRALAQLGIKSSWHTTLGFDHLWHSLLLELPSVIAIKHRGQLASPTGGHVITCIGRNPKGEFIFHDPYGSLLDPGGAYTGSVENGKAVVYPRWVLNHRWLVEDSSSGWGRLFK